MCHVIPGHPAMSRTASGVLIYVIAFIFCETAGQPTCRYPPMLKEISETSRPGTVIGTVATDKGLTWRYDFSDNTHQLDNLMEYFDFYLNYNKTLYKFVNARTVDLEELHARGIRFHGVCRVNMYCTTKQNFTKKYSRFLTVQQVNEFTPVFNVSIIKIAIPERLSICKSIIKLSQWAKDKDVNLAFPNEIRRFRVWGEGNTHSFIRMNNATEGDIVLKAELDYETMPNKLLVAEVSAEDWGGRVGKALLHISITDVDDMPPTFYYEGCRMPCESPLYFVQIEERFMGLVDWINPAPITARDGDSLGYNITYKLISNVNFQDRYPLEYLLTIDSHTGVPEVRVPLVLFRGKTIIFKVIAEEVSKARRSTSANFWAFIIRSKKASAVKMHAPNVPGVFSSFTVRAVAAAISTLAMLVLLAGFLYRGNIKQQNQFK